MTAISTADATLRCPGCEHLDASQPCYRHCGRPTTTVVPNNTTAIPTDERPDLRVVVLRSPSAVVFIDGDHFSVVTARAGEKIA